MPFADYLIQPGEMTLSPEAIDRKRKLAQMLQQQGMDSSPVQSWTQGAARLVSALSGNLREASLDKAEKANMDRGNAVLSGLAGALMGNDTSPASSATGGASAAAPAPGDYFSTMAQKESGGNPNIKNAQGSGATGLYQFMPGTWRGLMEKYPSLGLTYDGMTDPQQQQVAMRQFTADNAKALQAAGIPVNNATLAIAHQQGAGGAIKLLTNPDAPAVNVVGAKAVTMNGGDPRMTAGQFAQKVAGYYMGGSQGLTDRLSPQAAQNVLSGQPGPVPGARADMGAVAAPDRITPQAMQAVMTNQPGPVPGARTDMTASTMPMTLSPQAAGNVMSGQPGPVPGARLPVAQALADIPAAGAQPAGYQIPGQAPMPAPAAPAAMPAQANRAALMQKVIQAWPYLSESQRQQAQMILQMAPKPMTPLEQAQMQEAQLKVQDMLHNQQNWSTSDAQAQANLDKTRLEMTPEASRKLQDALTNWQRYGLPDPHDAKNQNFWQDFSSKVMGGAGQTIATTINNATNPILENLGKQFTEQRQQANDAADTVRAIHSARQQLEGGIISGAGADQRLALQKIGALIGVADPTQIANTETFRTQIKPLVLSMVKGLGAGTGISNADRDFAMEAVGGSINLDEKTIARVLDITERAARAKIDRFNKQSSKMLETQPTLSAIGPMMAVDQPEAYQPAAPNAGIAAPVNPAANPAQAPGAQPTAPQTGGYPDGTVISNGKQKMIRRGGQWVPM